MIPNFFRQRGCPLPFASCLLLGLLPALSLAQEPQSPAGTVRPGKLPPQVQIFINAYCTDCHDDATAKAKLSLESLPAVFGDPVWVRVHDRIAAGEMPPKNKLQPKPEEVAAVAQWLSQELTKSAILRQQTEGRVLLRRMNRREYETTLHDLLGIAEPLASLLPEDTVTHGFDTTSSGLATSATHLLRYQEAADRAIHAALPVSPITSKVTRWTGRQYLDGRLPVHRASGIDPYVRLEGDAMVVHGRISGDMGMQAPHPPLPGRYRVRAAVRLVNTNGKPMSVLIGKRVDRFQAEKLMHVIDYQDVPPGKTTILEVETDLRYSSGNQFAYFEGMALPWPHEVEKSRGERGKQPLETDFAGPGLVFEWTELEGPLDVEKGYRQMFGDLPKSPRMPEGQNLPEKWRDWNPEEYSKYPLAAQSADAKADADRLIRAFLPMAFRGPVTGELAAHYVGIAHKRLESGEPFDDAMRATCKAILCSPHFLNYIETPGRLDDHAVASRLARFLWNSMPDQELFDTAATGTLTKPEILRAQTERMLQDPKSARFARSFTDQWLDLAKFLDMKPAGYIEYDDMLAWSMPLETRRFFDEVLALDLPVSSFFHSDWTFLNARLAKHYGIAGVEGDGFRKVVLQPEQHRGGVITHSSVLKLTTNATTLPPSSAGHGCWNGSSASRPPLRRRM